MMDDDVIVFPDDMGICLVPDWLPYSPFRVKRMLKEIGCDMNELWQGYKANRRPGYCKLYRITRISDGEVVRPCINMHSLQKFFAKQGFPLYDEKSACNQSKRCKGAERFLQAVANLSDMQN